MGAIRDAEPAMLESTSESSSSIHGAVEDVRAGMSKYGQASSQYDPAIERKLRLKIDLYIIPTVSLLYLFCFIDRANIGNAAIAGLRTDLNMKGYDYNILITAFYISYIVFEIPANLVCKWMGPGWFIPLTTVLFGAASLATAFVHTVPQAAGVRFVLGVFEAGMMPGIAYFLSRWYRRAELAFRLGMYVVMSPLAGAFGGLLASAILSLDSFGSLHSWRMLFAIEGMITCGLGVLAFFTLTDRPETARWLTPEEKNIAISRIQSERMGTSAVLDKMDRPKIVRGIFNPVTMCTAFIFLLGNITVQGLAVFAPTIVKTIYSDRTTIQQQLYTVPPYVVSAFFTLLFPFLSWRTDRRQLWLVLSTPFVIIGYSMFVGSTDPTVRYAALFLATSSTFAGGPLTNAHISANVVSDTARSAAFGANVMIGSIGGLIAAWSFLPWDAPNYYIGNGLNLATSITSLIIGSLLLVWMKWDNKRRESRNVEKELEGLTAKEIEDLEWKHPAFRWKP